VFTACFQVVYASLQTHFVRKVMSKKMRVFSSLLLTELFLYLVEEGPNVTRPKRCSKCHEAHATVFQQDYFLTTGICCPKKNIPICDDLK